MRRTDKEVRDQGWIDAVLFNALFCHLALVDDVFPCLVTMNFVWSEGKLILHSVSEGEKIELLKKNPNVAFAVETDIGVVSHSTACGYGMRYRSVIGRGTARFVDSYDEKNRLLRLLSEKYTSCPVDDFSRDTLNHVTVFVITPTSLTGKNSGYSQGRSNA